MQIDDEIETIKLGKLLCPSVTGDIYRSHDKDLIQQYSAPEHGLLLKVLPDYCNSSYARYILQTYIENKELQDNNSHISFLALSEKLKVLVYLLPKGEMLSTWVENKRLAFTGTTNEQQFIAFLKQLNNILIHLSRLGMQHGRITLDSIYISDQGQLYLLDTLVVNTKLQLLEKKIIPFQMIPNSEAITASPEQCFGRKIKPQDNVFNLSILIYQLYTGQHPYNGKNAVQALLAKAQVPKLPPLSEQQWDKLKYGLALRRKNRITSVHKLIEQVFNYSNLSSKNFLLNISPRPIKKIEKISNIEVNNTVKPVKKSTYPTWLLLPIILGWLSGTGLMFFLLGISK